MSKYILIIALFIMFLVGFSHALRVYTVNAYGTDFLFQVKCQEIAQDVCDGKHHGVVR